MSNTDQKAIDIKKSLRLHKHRFGITVGELRAVIRDLSDDTPVVISGYDHSYDPAGARLTTALAEPVCGRIWSEDYGDLNDEDSGPSVEVLLIS